MHHSTSIRQCISPSVFQFIGPSATPWISTWISVYGSREKSQLLSNLIIQSFHHHEDASLALWALLDASSHLYERVCSSAGRSVREKKSAFLTNWKKSIPTVHGPCWIINLFYARSLCRIGFRTKPTCIQASKGRRRTAKDQSSPHFKASWSVFWESTSPNAAPSS